MRGLRAINKIYLRLPFVLRLLVACCVFVLFLVSLQSLLIFPGAVISLRNYGRETRSTLPAGVVSSFVTTQDGKRLELWRLAGGEKQSPVAVIFHGNGGDVANFFPYQKYFASIGVTNYGFDYRGYGLSTGWPSERGLEIDADTVVKRILDDEHIEARDLILVGISIGSGPASYAAAKVAPHCLLLLSPFTSLPAAIRSRPVLGVLWQFAFYKFPVAENVGRLRGDCLIVAHGEEDDVVPFAQGRAVFAAGHVRFQRFVAVKGASHNDILPRGYPQVTKALAECFSGIGNEPQKETAPVSPRA
jgi:pimeloyl-ACP methyl ester carboxylesterase